MNDRQLLVNSIITPDGTVLTSRYRHDYVTHIDKNGEEYMVDGGLDYERCNINKIPAIDNYVYTDDPHELIRNKVAWGTYGKGGAENLHYVLLREMSTGHIKAVLEILNVLPRLRVALNNELTYRMEHP